MAATTTSPTRRWRLGASSLASNWFVAVELHTFKQAYDPSDNHIGLPIDSVVSVQVGLRCFKYEKL